LILIPQAPLHPGILNRHYAKEKLKVFRARVNEGEQEMKSTAEVSCKKSTNQKLSLLSAHRGFDT